MKSLGAGVARVAARLVNRAPVPHPGARRVSIPSLFSGGSDDEISAMSQVGTVYSIVADLALSVASHSWHMHRTNVRGGICEVCEEHGDSPKNVTLVEDHLALRRWNEPNPFMPGSELREAFQQYHELKGIAHLVVERGETTGLPVAIWPVRPDRMMPRGDADNWLTGYAYRGPDGMSVPLELDEVLRSRIPNPEDPFGGLSPIPALLADIGGMHAASEWNQNFFHNAALPGGVLEVPTELSSRAYDRLKEQWASGHKGVSNAHRVGILENGIKWADRNVSQRDMEFPELIRLGKENVREGWRYPIFRQGTVQDVNRSTAETAETSYISGHVVPRLNRIKEMLNTQFLPMFKATGMGVQFVYVNPVKEDRESANAERDSKTAAYKTLIDAGVEPADAARCVGLQPMQHIERAKTVPKVMGGE